MGVVRKRSSSGVCGNSRDYDLLLMDVLQSIRRRLWQDITALPRSYGLPQV